MSSTVDPAVALEMAAMLRQKAMKVAIEFLRKMSSTVDPAVALEMAAMLRQKAMKVAIELGNSDIQQFYSGTTVFVTGGSGFLGKLLIEKLFRSCEIKKLYMLLRPSKDKTIDQRLDMILKDPVFDSLRDKQPNFANRICVIEGDVASIRVGINDKNWRMITEEVNVIFHVAATISFQQPLHIATLTNIRGTREVLTLGKNCKSLRSFVHVSTAYSHATSSRIGAEISEQFYSSPVPPELLIKLAENNNTGTLDTITAKIIEGWPNTYVYTKAVGEELVRTMSEGLPVCIVRPSIVIGTYREPSPGWLDMSSVYGASGITLGSIMGIIHVVLAKQDIKIDLVPADYVNNAIISAGWETGNTSSPEIKIYNVTSSRNYLYWGGLAKILNDEARCSLISPQALWYCFVIQTTNKFVYLLLTGFLHIVPAFLIDGISLLIGKRPRFLKIYMKIHKLTSVLVYYTLNDWVFKDLNIQKLFKKMSDKDKIIYNFDITTIQWTEQIMMWCLGLRKYIVKDELKNTKYALKKQFYFKIVTYILVILCIYKLWKIICTQFFF